MARTQHVPGHQSRKKLATKQPLQDITDRYLLHPSPNVDRPTPTSRPKPNASRGTESARPMLPSSLPPSSPPSASSGPLTDHYFQPISSSGRLEIDKAGHVKTAGASHTNSRADSDPFGFFALENKLKILRRHQQVQPRLQSARPPQIQTVYKYLTTPPTPSQRRNKRKAVRSPIPSDKGGSEPDSMPSTPLKPISRKGKEKVIPQDKPTSEAESDGDSLETLTSSLKRNPRRRRNVKDSLKESGNSSERYSLRRDDAAANSGKDLSSKRKREEARCASMPGAVVRSTRVKPRVKRTTKPTSIADMNKWEQERQARLDYFKKLEGYQLEKENVYVV